MKKNRNAIGTLGVLLSVAFIRIPVWCVAALFNVVAIKTEAMAMWVDEWAPGFERNDF